MTISHEEGIEKDPITFISLLATSTEAARRIFNLTLEGNGTCLKLSTSRGDATSPHLAPVTMEKSPNISKHTGLFPFLSSEFSH